MPRVICTKPNASQECDGILWGRIQVGDGQAVLVSAEIDEKQEAHYLAMPGYAPYTGSEKAAREAVAAFEKERLLRPTPKTQAATTIRELQVLVDRLVAERRVLQEQLARLQAELEALRAGDGESPPAGEDESPERELEPEGETGAKQPDRGASQRDAGGRRRLRAQPE